MLFEEERTKLPAAHWTRPWNTFRCGIIPAASCTTRSRKKLEDDHAAAAAVARCVELGLINDEAFARHRAKYLLARHKSPAQIRAIWPKGVDRQIAAQVLEELFEGKAPPMRYISCCAAVWPQAGGRQAPERDCRHGTPGLFHGAHPGGAGPLGGGKSNRRGAAGLGAGVLSRQRVKRAGKWLDFRQLPPCNAGLCPINMIE